jgi:putative membrane protein
MVWLVALAIATKSHLRQDLKPEHFETLLTHVEFSKLEASVHPPLLILRWLEDFNAHRISVESRELFRERFAALTAGITGCERIVNTPLPFAYAIFLRQSILIYCFFLPFGLVATLTWGIIPLTIFVSFFLLGVEAIAAEIENPFGEDENDLPLDELCRKITAEAKEYGILKAQLKAQDEPLTEIRVTL